MSRILPDFSQIEFVSHENPARPTQLAEKTDLFKLFNAIINNESLEVTEGHLKNMLSEDLNIPVNKIDERLVGILREALVYYMTIWPGWQRSEEYYRGEFSCIEWFTKFRNYLEFTTHMIIKNADKFAAELCKETVRKDAAVQVQVNPLDKKIAPYTLCIAGPPNVLDNIAFEEFSGGILIRHQKEQPWSNLKIKPFLNWPYISVNVKLPGIIFTRTNTHQFERYMSFRDSIIVHPEVNHIKHIKKIADVGEDELVPYSYDFIGAYLQQLYQTLKEIPEINRNRLQELKAIFVEFLADIKEVNVYNCTMCTHISIGYNIGKCKYVRISRVEKKTVNQNAVDYYEIFTPQVDFTLDYFKAVQDRVNTEKITFTNINRLPNSNPAVIKNLVSHINNTCLEYCCTLCSKVFLASNAYLLLTEHFSEEHKSQPAVRCSQCYKEFPMALLAEQRWSHACT